MSERKNERRGLGRGLSALMADVAPASEDEDVGRTPAPDSQLPIEKVRPNPNQPRRRFGEEALNELAQSIREKGILQPLIVRASLEESGIYEIVAGERRWRAAQMAQLHRVPVVIREFDDSEVLEVAIIENIQRADLDPVEEAEGYNRLMEAFGHTQERLAEILGKSRSHVANTMRLLGLPKSVREMLQAGKLTAGHARALLTSDDPEGLAREIVAKGLSVREAERLAKKAKTKKPSPTAPSGPSKDADTRALEQDLSAAIGLKVIIDHSSEGEAGKLSIAYPDLDALDGLCQRLTKAGVS